MADFRQIPSQAFTGACGTEPYRLGAAPAAAGRGRRERGYARSVAQPDDDLFDEHPDRARRISQVTRRDIFDYLRAEGGLWLGRMTEIDFLGRLYDLEALPSTDSRFATAGRDIVQHRVANFDWDDDWVFGDPRFRLAVSGHDVCTSVGSVRRARCGRSGW